MRGIPGLGRRTIVQSPPVIVAEHDRALRAARVVLAGHVLVRRERVPLGSRAGQDVVLVWPVTTTGNYFAFFGEIVLLAELVVRAMQVIDAGRDHDAFDVLPGALADAVARV